MVPVLPCPQRWTAADNMLAVEGGRGWEVETGIDETMPVWLGEEPTRRLREHLKTVGKGMRKTR
jgi:hypothetical protein